MPVPCCPGEFGNLIIDFDVEKIYSSWLRDPQIRKRIREALPRIEDQGRKSTYTGVQSKTAITSALKHKICRIYVKIFNLISAGPEIKEEMMLEDYCEDRHTSRKRRRDESSEQPGLSNEQCRTQWSCFQFKTILQRSNTVLLFQELLRTSVNNFPVYLE